MNPHFIKKRSIFILTAFILLLALNLQGCSMLQYHSKTYNRPFVNVIIKHDVEDIHAAKIGIFDFGHSAKLEGLGASLAQITRNYLLSNKVIGQIELIGKQAETDDHCIQIGKTMGYDLIFIGHINDIFYGGINSNSRISISIKIIDVQNKTILWYSKGDMEAEYEELADYIFFIKGSRPAPFPSELGGVLINALLRETVGVDPVKHRKDQTDRLKSFLNVYCQTYENKDIDKLADFFASDALENNRPFHELLPKYRRNLEAVKLFNYQIELMDYYWPADTEKVMVQGEYFVRYLVNGDDLNENRGNISMELIEDGDSYLIKRLSYR